MKKILLAAVLTVTPSLAMAQSMPAWKSYMATGNTADIVPSAGTSDSVAAWLAKKVDTTNGTASGLTITNGSATGTDISAAYASSTFPVSSYVTSHKNRFTVYLGAVTGMGQLAHDVQQSLSAGNIALYEHATGMNIAFLSASDRVALQAAWAKTGFNITTGGGTGMAELGCCSLDAAGYTSFGGAVPALAALNLPDTNGGGGDGNPMTDAGEASDEAQMKVLYAYPNMAKNIAPVMRPDPTQPEKLWDTDDLYAPNRKLALFAGGVTIDMPPTLAMSESSGALDNYANEIVWAIKNNLRATLIVSPYVLGKGGCVFDANLVENTKSFVSYLLSKAPAPTEYVVENYCGESGNTVNTPSGDSVSESLNQVALYLSTLPVSPAATATPAISGALSEADAISEGNLYSSARAPELTFSAPFATNENNPMPLSDIRSIIDNRINTFGSMSYQSDANVNIQGGNINGVNNPLNITICPTCSLLMQTNMTFQAVNGNVVAVGSKTDPTLTLYNPYTTTPVGITLGSPSDTLAPKMLLGTGPTMSNEEGMMFQSENEVVIGLHSLNGLSNIGVSTTGLTTITNPAANQDYKTGIEFTPPGLAVASRPSVSVTNDGTVMKVVAPTVNFSGAINATGNIGLNSGKSIIMGADGSTKTFLFADGQGNNVLTGNATIRGSVTENGVTDTTMTGSGNAYACVDASGHLYRSSTACN